MGKTSRIVCVLSLLSFLPGCSTTPPSQKPPNIILILADDLGYSEIGAFGQGKIETPHIDGLAASGMRFTQHYSGSAVCAPSRCVLLTGLHTGHAAIRGNDEWAARGDVWDYAAAVEDPSLEGQRPIPADTVTLGALLQEAGYRTAIVGKWGLGGPLTEGIPNLQGFDFFFGFNCQRQAHTFYPRHLWRNQEKVWLDNELVVPGTRLPEGADPLDPVSYRSFTQSEYAPDLMLDEALGFIESNRDDPFFLYFATPMPHVPLQAPAEWVERYVDKFGDEAPYLGDKGYFPHRYPHAAYAAMVSYLDSQVGKIVQRLQDLGLYENTILLFTSDNGPSYAGGTDPIFFDSAHPFRSDYGRAKGFLYEGGIRVPLVASWPGKIQAGSSSGHISSFYDLLPTLCEIAGAQVPSGLDGISLAGTLLGRDVQREHEFLYWEFPSYGGQQAVRLGDWKAIRRNILEGNLEIELFNLEADPLEENDVAAREPEVMRRIRRILASEHTRSSIERFQFPQLGD